MGVRPSEAVKEQIRQAINIVDVVSEVVSLQKAGKDFKGLCPFHTDSRPSLMVSPTKQIYKCFACGAGGDVFSFIQRRENVSFPEALSILADRTGIQLETRSSGPAGGPSKAELARVNSWAVTYFQKRLNDAEGGRAAREYLQRRGISEEITRRFALGLAIDSFEGLVNVARQAKHSDKLLLEAGLVKSRETGGVYDTFRHRLMFPIVDAMDRTIGFGGRTLGDDQAKYLNTPETMLFDKGRSLYGLNQARRAIGERGRAIVVEGYTDCLMCHQFGFTEAVATLGTAMTAGHAELLRRYTNEVVLIFDSDEAGHKAADRALHAALIGRLSVRIASVPQGKDPCDFLLTHQAEGFAQVVDNAVDALEFKWQEMFASEGAGSRREAMDSFLNAVVSALSGGMLDPIEQGLMNSRLSGLLGVSVSEVGRAIASRQERSSPQRDQPLSPAARVEVPRGAGNAEQSALRQILEVLVCESGHYAAVADVLRPERFEDRELALVAREVIALAEELGEFQLVDLLSRFEDPAFGELITDLQTQGEHRGSYQQTIEGALVRLRQVAHRRETTVAGRSVVHLQSKGAEEEATDEALRAFSKRAEKDRGFAPRAVVSADQPVGQSDHS
jgi:DNA primase